jgi:hypothetical protein
MFLEILAHTPRWVFALFALLVWLGCKQLITSRVSLKRITVMPIAMTGLSLYGVVSAFKDSPMALTLWVVAAVALAFLLLQRQLHEATRYDASTRSFEVPGSAVPLMLMMGIFFTKYIVGVQLAMHPALAHQPGFVLPVSVLYGAFSGIFAARALRLWKLAMRTDRTSGMGQTAT